MPFFYPSQFLYCIGGAVTYSIFNLAIPDCSLTLGILATLSLSRREREAKSFSRWEKGWDEGARLNV